MGAVAAECDPGLPSRSTYCLADGKGNANSDTIGNAQLDGDSASVSVSERRERVENGVSSMAIRLGYNLLQDGSTDLGYLQRLKPGALVVVNQWERARDLKRALP